MIENDIFLKPHTEEKDKDILMEMIKNKTAPSYTLFMLLKKNKKELYTLYLKHQTFTLEEMNNFCFIGTVFNDIPFLKLALEKGADINADSGKALSNACNSGSEEMVLFLLENGANPNIEENFPLRLALDNDLKIIKLLLRFGAKVSENDEFIKTVCRTAIYSRRIELVNLFIKEFKDKASPKNLNKLKKARLFLLLNPEK